MSIHPTAMISPTAQIAADAEIGAYSTIGDHVVIGEGCIIEPFAIVKGYTRMGKKNTISSYAMVGGVPQDLKYHGEESWLILGDNNTVREFATLHRGTADGGGETRIGNNCLIMAYCHVAHDCVLGDSVIMSNNATLGGHVIVQDHAILGGLCAVHQHCRVGKYSFIGGTTGVGLDVPPYMLASGTRAGLQGPNIVGLRRAGISRETIGAIKAAFELIWLSGKIQKNALTEAEELYGNVPEVMDIVEFIRGSDRGVMHADRSLND